MHNSIFILFAGIFKHSQAVSKAYLADITPDIQRPAILGKFNAVSSLGFILGPIFGGHIAMAERGFYKVAILSGVAFLANAIFVLIMIPDMEMSKLKIQRELKVDQCNDHHEKQTNSKQHNPQKSKPSIIELITAAQSLPWEKIADIFIIRFINSLAMIVFRSSFVVMLEFRYGTTPKQNGYILSFNGVIGAISGMIVGRIASVFSRYNDMHRFFSVLMALSLTYITFAPRLSLLVLGLVPLSLSTAVLRVTNMTALYKRAGDKEKGLLTGLGDSLTSFARMIGPTVGGITLDISMYGPGALGSLLAVGAMVLGFIRDLDGSDITLEKKLK